MLHVVTALAVSVSAPPVALTVSPARAALLAPAARTVEVRNLGTEQVAVDVARKSLDRKGASNRWLTIAPSHLVLRGGARALLTVRAGYGASPGDHNVLVLVTGRPAARAAVSVRLRLGVRLRIRAPGKVIRRIVVDGLRAQRFRRKRALLVALANRGNVTEQLRGRLTVTLIDRKRIISRLRFRRSRELYPGARAVVALAYAGRARGVVTALVSVRGGQSGRRYRLRL